MFGVGTKCSFTLARATGADTEKGRPVPQLSPFTKRTSGGQPGSVALPSMTRKTPGTEKHTAGVINTDVSD